MGTEVVTAKLMASLLRYLCLLPRWGWQNLFPLLLEFTDFIPCFPFFQWVLYSLLSKMVKLDIHTLAHHLKQERLYVNSEKQLIQRLNADVLKTAEKLYRTAWISKQQRINLDRLIITRWLGGVVALGRIDTWTSVNCSRTTRFFIFTL